MSATQPESCPEHYDCHACAAFADWRSPLEKAAPDLLDACQVALDFMTLSLGYDDTDFQVCNLRAAIAKARGGK